MARAFIVLRALDHTEKEWISTALDSTENVRLYTKSEDPFPGRSTLLPALDAEEKKRINFDIFDKIVHFGDQRILNTTAGRLLTFNTAGLWYYHKFRTYFQLRNLAYDLAALDKIAGAHDTAYLLTDNKALTVPGVVSSNIKVIPPGSSAGKSERHIRAVAAFLATSCIRLLTGLFTQHYRLKKTKHVFADSRWQYRNILAKTGEGDVYENAYLGYLYQETDNRFAFIDQLIIPKFGEAPAFRIEPSHLRNHGRRNRINEEVIFLRGLLHWSTLMEIRKSLKRLKSLYPALAGLEQTDRYDRLIIHSLNSLHKSSLYYLVKYHVYQRFFRINRVYTVTATDENSPNFKIILDAARANGITTIGYQHGSIHPLHPAYMYSRIDMENPPVPDHTLLWGPKWRNMLLNKGNYSPERVHVTGQLRTDVIVCIRNNTGITREKLLPHCHNQFVVLFASQPQRDPHLRYKAAEDVFTAVRDLPGGHLVLKLHPRERDPEYYRSIARATGCNNFSFSGDLDLYVLLHLADVVVTCFSTVGTEAVYFEKPLVILDHLNQDILDYHKDGVAFQTSDAVALRQVLTDLMQGIVTYDRAAYAKYIEATAYKIDGQATTRFLSFLDSHAAPGGLSGSSGKSPG
jgi:hypothetical protein